MELNQILDIGFLIFSVSGAWFVVKYQVNELLKTQQAMFKKLDRLNEEVTILKTDTHTIKIEIDEYRKHKEKITILEQTTAHHIDLISAEQKFVTRREFEITVNNIHKELTSIDNNLQKMRKNIEEITKYLMDNKNDR